MRGGAAVFWIWAISIVLVWFCVALSLDQPLFMRQHSRDLVAFGAFKASDLTGASAWKLIASQWLHVKFPHVLFNALVIGIVGTALSRLYAWPYVLALGILGGAVGQYMPVVFQPDAYVSGASQAYLALCGMGVVVLARRSVGWWTALVGILVGSALDLFVAKHGGVKSGHIVPLAIGLTVGAWVWWFRSKSSARDPQIRINGGA